MVKRLDANNNNKKSLFEPIIFLFSFLFFPIGIGGRVNDDIYICPRTSCMLVTRSKT